MERIIKFEIRIEPFPEALQKGLDYHKMKVRIKTQNKAFGYDQAVIFDDFKSRLDIMMNIAKREIVKAVEEAE